MRAVKISRARKVLMNKNQPNVCLEVHDIHCDRMKLRLLHTDQGSPIMGLCYVKVLISENAITLANGIAGSGIEQLARDTSVSIRLGSPGDYFPTINERCLAATGSQTAVTTFLWNLGVRAPELMSMLALILPDSAVSAIIGRGGSTIKSMQESSGARIKVENRINGVKERILRISSSSGETLFKGLRAVLDKLVSVCLLRCILPRCSRRSQMYRHTCMSVT